jgi:GntR family transcriptional regulator, negative regulator for fad regulon and positive regulator of fabA
MNWESPQRPAELTESRLIAAILDGTFPINSQLPAERELAERLGVTRPTLREALQRLGRDGWLEIHQGKPTRVRNYWQEGNLGLLNAITRDVDKLPPDFVTQLLEARISLAPDYAALAVARHPAEVAVLLASYRDLGDTAEAYSEADFELHHRLTVASANPVYTLILNGFSSLYRLFGPLYFSIEANRRHSQVFYRELETAAINKDSQAARAITLRVMSESLQNYHELNSTLPGGDL